MDKRLIEAYDRMTMPDDCAQRIERKMRRALRQKKGGIYTMEVRPGAQRQGWGIAAALVALVLVLSAGGAFFFLKASEPVATATVPEETTLPGGVWQEYADAGIRFSYPQGWGITGDGSVTTFCDAYPSQRTVMCLERTQTWEADLTADAEHQQAILRERWPDAEVSEVEPAAVGGGDALKLTYTYTDGGVTHCVVQYTTAVQIRTAVDAVGYRLYFYPPAENPESFDAVRDAILNSLEFLKTAQGCYPEDYTYNRNIGGGITIATYLGNDENICIPDEIDGRQVTAISEEPGYYSGEPGAFSGCGTLRAVTIPEGVTKIGDNSFAGCVSLQTVYVPTTVKEIGSGAFSNCPSLKRVIFAGDAPSHGSYVFDASLNVSVIYRKGTSGWEDTWAGRPTCLLDKQTVGVDSYTLSDQGIAFLEKMCYFMPDWSDYASLNESFWKEFLFRSFTSPELTDNGTAMTVCGEQELADTPWGQAVKVSRGQTVEPYVRLAMGCELPALTPSQEDMESGQTPLYYDMEDGCYYIGLSDFGDIGYTYRGSYTYQEAYSICVTAAFTMYSGEPGNIIGEVGFTLVPRDNENGFTITGKITYGLTDQQKVPMIVSQFYDAYFDGDTERMKQYLADDYKGHLDVYQGGSSQDVVVQSVETLSNEETSQMVRVTFLETELDDSYTYLMLELVKEEDNWRISSYGLDK